MKRASLLKWWLIFCLIIAGSVLSYLTGMFSQVNDADFTKISFLIYGLFIMSSVQCGVHTYRKILYQDGHRMASRFIKLGLMGTLFGLVYVFTTSLGNIDPSQAQTMRTAISTMMKGMGTALYTTLIGLICSFLLRLQLDNLEDAIGKRK